MATDTRHSYLPYLLVAAGLMALAAATLPWDIPVASSVRAFSHGVGARYFTQELLAFIRPFGKGEVLLLLAFLLGLCGARKQAIHIVLALLLTGILVWPFKLAVGRERPNLSNDESFPSGDTASVVAFCAPLAAASPWGAAIGAVAGTAVAAGRIYDGKHFPSDVLTGASMGVLAAAIAAAILRRRSPKIRRRSFLLAAAAVLVFDFVKLPWARALPYALAFLSVWGPILLFLLLSRLAPSWIRWQRAPHRRRMRIPLLTWMAALILCVYFALTTASSLWDRDEPRFSRATVEMVQSGNYLYPTFNGDLRPDKPILIYWLMSVPVRLFGPSEFACRMVAPLATLGAALLTARIASLLAGPATATPAFLMLALSPLMAVSGTAATTDALLLFCVVASLYGFLLSWRQGFRPRHAMWMSLALAGALLTKGPVGLLPVLVMLVTMVVAGRGALRLRSYSLWLAGAVLVAAGFFLAWGLPANLATDGQFGAKGLGHHVVQRAVTPLESHGGKSFLFYFTYLPVIVFAFFPWTLYLPFLFTRTSLPAGSPREAAQSPVLLRRTLLSWAIPILVVMSLVATKLPHYILPAFPALAVGGAVGAHRAKGTGGRRPRGAAARTGLTLFCLAGFSLGAALTLVPWFLPVFGLRVPATGLGLLFLAMTFVGARQFRRGRHEATVMSLAAGMLLVLLTAAFFLLPAIESYKIAPRLAAFITSATGPQVPVSTCGFGEPSLTFYLNRGIVESVDESGLAEWVRRRTPGVLAINRTKLKKNRHLFRRDNLQVLGRIHGFNYSQGKWVTVVLMERKARNR